jgi:class 3 adenylate cyclase/tetratricopeptide (TPR) repeat protein
MDAIELCSECRAPLQRDAKFCAACGHAIGDRLLETQRRQLTLLFCDIVGSTNLSERLDPEDFRDLLASFQRTCRDATEHYGGRISQFLGDGVMAYHGYPSAHEDDPVRAINAALRIVDGIGLVNEGIGKRLGAEIHVRIGLHTGVAVVGDVGPDSAHDRRPVGEIVNLAARIQSFADADTIVVSAPTASLVMGHFELESLGAPTLKGFTRPVELFRVLRPTGARTKFEAAARGKLTPHVGRNRELGEMERLWNEVREGADRVVIVRGEPGIGKSRILHHFRQVVLGHGARVLECYCSPLTQATAFAPLVDMLSNRVAARADGEETTQGKLEALRSMLGEHSRFGADALPLMAAVLSIPGADEAPIQDLSPVRRRARTLEIMRSWMASSAERTPLVLLVEDLHWADPSTLDCLDLIARESPGGRTFLCVTARPELPARWAAPHVRTIELARLGATEIEAMITHIAGGHELPPLVVRRIVERSEGVPLFVEELTKAVLESGALRLEIDRYEFARTFNEQFLPSSVQGSLVARFDRLGDGRKVCQLGAAIGREFTYPLIRVVSGVSDDELRQHLDRLSQSELASVHGDPPSSVYTFKHALIQDTIYSTLPKSERTQVHERIFTALQEKFPEISAARPEMAAYHAERAGRRDAAVPLLKAAGMRDYASTAMVEAVKHLERAIELVDALEEPARVNMEGDLQAVIGPAYMATLGWAAPEVERSSTRLRDLAAAKGDGPRLFQAMWGLWTVQFLRGQFGNALDIARQVLGMALQSGDPMLVIAGHHAVGYTHFYRGEYAEALGHAEEGLSRFDLELDKRIASIFQLSSSCALWSFRAQAHQVLGDAQKASDSLSEADRLVEQLHHNPSRAFLLCQMCNFFRLFDDIPHVESSASAMRLLSTAEGFALWIPVADVFLSWAAARTGSNALHAAERIQTSLALVHQGHTYINEPDLACMLADTFLLGHRPEDAFRITQDALAIARIGDNRHGEPELFRLQGDAAAAMGNTEKAAASYRQGMDSSRLTRARLLELRCGLALARLTNGTQERAALRSILDGFMEPLEHPDYTRARMLLESAQFEREAHAPSLNQDGGSRL